MRHGRAVPGGRSWAAGLVFDPLGTDVTVHKVSSRILRGPGEPHSLRALHRREKPAPAGAGPDRHEPRSWLRGLRYASCWEDAAVVAEALAPLAEARCLSIASGGDNTFSILARRPARASWRST